LDRTDFRNGPSRPDVTSYAGRHARDGSMYAEQRAAHFYNLKVNQNYFEHQRTTNQTRPERHQPAPEKSAPAVQRESRRPDLHPAPAARTPERTPAQTPARQPARLELRHGFNVGVPVSKPDHQVRRSYEQAPQRDDSTMRNRMREAGRETLRPHAGPERPQAQELNRPAPERSRGLDR
jgi:hypothetical protein